jgi:twitching motility protein PilI
MMVGATGPDEDKWLSPVQALTHYIPSAELCPLAKSRETFKRGTECVSRYGFRIGNIGFLLAPEKLSEVVGDVRIHPIPTTPIWFSGLINLRGNLVPIFDLGELFGIDKKEGKRLNLLVVDRGPKAIGVPIEGLPHTVPTARRLGQLPPLPPILQDLARVAYVHEKNIWLEFDFERLFRAIGALMVD